MPMSVQTRGLHVSATYYYFEVWRYEDSHAFEPASLGMPQISLFAAAAVCSVGKEIPDE